MPVVLPSDAPQTLGEAFARINSVTAPTMTDLKVMVLVEAAGQTLYEKSAEGADDPRVKALLIENGHEEMKHARRAAEAIKLLTGEEFPAPTAADNPYLTGHIPVAAITPEGLRKTAESEFNGDALYARWADSLDNAAAAELLRANGREETDHGNRLLEAAAILEAQA
ncbi:MAG: ferritin family protein [Sphingomonadaceae bacterium]|jgi:rubrerythrin